MWLMRSLLLVLSLSSSAWAQPLAEPAPSAGVPEAAQITSLVEALGSESNSVGWRASRRLVELGGPAVPALTKALRGADARRAERAASTLGELGPRASTAAPALLYVVTHSTRGQNSLSATCAQALAGLGEVAVRELCEAARQSPEGFHRWRSLRVLRWIALRGKGEADGAVPTLTLALTDEQGSARAMSAYALKAIGAPAAPAIPALVKGLDDPEESVQRAARESLTTIAAAIEAEGGWPWWQLLRVYRTELSWLCLGLLSWFFVAAWAPRHRPRSALPQFGWVLATSGPPALVVGVLIFRALAPAWVTPFLPENPTALPFPWAGALSGALLLALPGVWVCQRKERAPESQPLAR